MPFERAADITYEVFDGQAVLIDPRTSEMVTLNPVGSLVWQELDGEKTVHDLGAALLPSLAGVTADVLERDITTFLGALAESGLVTDTANGG